MDIEIALAKNEDKEYIWPLFLNAMKGYVTKIWGWDDDWQIQEFERNFTTLNTSLLILNKQRIGYIQYVLNEGDTYLNMVVLEPSVRSRGIGKHLLTKLEDFQKEKPLLLRCFKINKSACNFYLKNEFRVIEEAEIFYLLRRESSIT